MTKANNAVKKLLGPKEPQLIADVIEPVVSRIERTSDSGILNKVEAFSDLLSLSLREATKIMETEVGVDHPLYAKIASTKQAIMASVFSTAARIDETSLRRQNASKLDEILAIVREQEEILSVSKTIEAKPSVQ